MGNGLLLMNLEHMGISESLSSSALVPRESRSVITVVRHLVVNSRSVSARLEQQ